MRVAPETVGMSGEQYRQHIELLRQQREVRRCLLALDVAGIRKVWREAAPHLDQPESDWLALHTMHLARVRMQHISPQQKRYSEHWLRELASKTVIARAVGIAVKASRPENKTRALDVQMSMQEAVLQAVKDGVHLEYEVPEVRHRMSRARQKAYGGKI